MMRSAISPVAKKMLTEMVTSSRRTMTARPTDMG
jgi:hypothetical protein